MSVEVLLPDAYSTDTSCPQVDTGQVGIGIAEGGGAGVGAGQPVAFTSESVRFTLTPIVQEVAHQQARGRPRQRRMHFPGIRDRRK